MKFLCAILLFIASAASAASYFVDYVGGNDANNGTSTATPWKTHPYMANSTVSGYSHAAGDQFKFKGGVTWPNACFPLTLNGGGTSGSRDYYGVDATWFTGGSFTRPVFDAAATVIGGKSVFIDGDTSAARNTTIDNIIFMRYRWTSGGNAHQIYWGETSQTNFIVSNCLFTNWTHGGSAADSSYCIAQHGNNNGYSLVTNCVFDGRPNGTDSMGGVIIVPVIKNCVAGNLANGFLPGGVDAEVAFCVIGPINDSFDTSSHENNIETLGSGNIKIHDNVMFSPTAVCFLTSSDATSYQIYNNLTTNCSVITWQFDQYTSAAYTVDFYNNTCEGSSAHVRIQARGLGCITRFTGRNNHYITGANPYYIDGCATTFQNDHNLTNTLATAQANGYTFANSFAPTNATRPTVDQGTTTLYSATDAVGVTRPQGSAPDIGRYEWNAGGGPPPDTTPPVVTDTNVNPIAAFTATVNWTTDDAANSYVRYGTTTGFEVGTNSDPAFITAHAITLSSLAQGTTYYYQIRTTNSSGYGTITATNSFTTIVRPATPWYVSTNSAGANNGTNWANAWGLSDVVWASVLPGDTIYLDGGSYSNRTWTIGAAGLPNDEILITVSEDAGHNGNVIWDWDAQSDFGTNNTAITCNQNYVFFNGGTNNRTIARNLRNQTNRFVALVLTTGGTSNQVVNWNFTNCNNAIRISGNHFLVRGCNFGGQRGDFCIDGSGSQGTYDNNIIENCVFESLYRTNVPSGGPGSQYGGPDAIWCGGGITIRSNLFKVSATASVYTSNQHNDGIQNTGDYVKVLNNKVINIGDSWFDNDCYWDQTPNEILIANNECGITDNLDPYPEFFRLYSSIQSQPCLSISNVRLINNTFTDSDGDYRVIRFDSYADVGTGNPTATNNLIANNIFYNCGSNFTFTPLIRIDESTNFTASSFVFSNNVYANIRNQPLYIHLRGTNYTSSTFVSSFDPGGRTNAPVFVSYTYQSAANDMRLASGDTAAIDKGLDFSAYFTGDKDGVVRAQGLAWDAGAYEYRNLGGPASMLIFGKAARVIAP